MGLLLVLPRVATQRDRSRRPSNKRHKATPCRLLAQAPPQHLHHVQLVTAVTSAGVAVASAEIAHMSMSLAWRTR